MRRTLFLAGVGTLALVWLGPLPGLAQHAFYAHMTMHMGVVAVAAPFLALGIAGTSYDPIPRYPRLFMPIPASVLELVIVWAWHAPALHQIARHSAAGLAAEQGSFLAAGVLVWLSAFGGRAGRSRKQAALGVVGLLLTSMHMTLLGALLSLTPRPLYVHLEGTAGLTALEDQHIGGAIMLLVGAVSYLLGGLVLTVSLLKSSAPQPEESV